MSGTGPVPSLARGLAIVALCCCAVVIGRIGWRVLPQPSGSLQPVCTAPVEVQERGGARLGCVGEPALRGCAGVQRGDRVRVTAAGCAVQHGGMGAALRLQHDLPLDINRASSTDLMLLPGIGPHLAAAIVAQRRAGGPFRHVSDLQRVHGIGPRTVARLAAQLTVGVVPARP